MTFLKLTLVAVLAASLAGCESATVKSIQQDLKTLFQMPKGGQDLANGIKQYEDANYGEAARLLQSALDQGLGRDDQVKAHKYLAFMHCVSGRPTQCRNEFRKALDADPDFVLQPAEAGHPLWGPVFTSVKARR